MKLTATSCLAALALLAAAQAVSADVPVDNFFARLGVDVPAPARNGNRLTHSMSLDDKKGGVLHFTFDVEHHPSLFAIDQLGAAAPIAVECSESGLRLTFASEEDARAAVSGGVADAGTIIAGGRQWGCETSILRKVVRKTASVGSTIIVETMPAGFEEAFLNADITFRTSMFPKNSFHNVAADNTAESQQHHQRRFVTEDDIALEVQSLFPSILKKAWSGLKEAVALAEKSMKAIYAASKALVKGDYAIFETIHDDVFNFNYDRSTQHAASILTPFPEAPFIQCQNCYADFDLELEFGLTVTSNKLKRIRTTVGGEAAFVAETSSDFEVAVPTQIASFHKQIAEIHAAPIIFDVAGVPFIIEFIVPIDLSVDISAAASGHISAGVGASGFLRFGFDYQGDWNSAWVVERGFSHFVHKPELRFDSIDAAVTVSLFPNMHVKLEHIGGPSLGLRLFSTISTSSVDASVCPTEPESVIVQQTDRIASKMAASFGLVNADEAAATKKTPFLVSVDVGTQILLGAFVDIKVGTKSLLKKEFTPLSVFSVVRRVSESCLAINLPSIGGAAAVITETLPSDAVGYEGRAWYTEALDCAFASATAGPAAVQMVGPMAVVLALNENRGPCTAQYLYQLAAMPAPGASIVAKRVSKDDLNLESCRAGSMTMSPPSSITIQFGSVFSQIQLSLGNNCVVNMY